MDKSKLGQTVKRVRLVASVGPTDHGRISGEIEIDLSAELGGKPLESVLRLGERLAMALAKQTPQELERMFANDVAPAPAPVPTRAPPPPKLEAELEPLAAGGGKAVRLGAALVIGRSKICDLPVPSAKVSRQHARVMSTGDGHVLEDLNSANHTFKNGERIEEPVVLADGDEIVIGDVGFRYRIVAGSSRTPARPRLANG